MEDNSYNTEGREGRLYIDGVEVPAAEFESFSVTMNEGPPTEEEEQEAIATLERALLDLRKNPEAAKRFGRAFAAAFRKGADAIINKVNNTNANNEE